MNTNILKSSISNVLVIKTTYVHLKCQRPFAKLNLFVFIYYYREKGKKQDINPINTKTKINLRSVFKHHLCPY